MPSKPARAKSIRANKKFLARTCAAGPLVRRSVQVERREAPPWETGAPGVTALPGGDCLTPPHPDWLPSEKWAWSRICRGEAADFNKRYGNIPDPRKEEDWEGQEGKRRLIRPEFIRMVLLHEPWRSAFTNAGLIVLGALVPGRADLSDTHIKPFVGLIKSRLKEDWDLHGVSFLHDFVLNESCIVGILNLDSSVINGSLFMRNGLFEGDVRLHGTRVNGQLSMDKSHLEGLLIMESSVIGGGLFMRSSVFWDDVRLHGARVDVQLSMNKSHFGKVIAMDNATVNGSIFMHKGLFQGKVRMHSAKVKNNVSVFGAKFLQKISFQNLNVVDLFARCADLEGGADFNSCKVNGFVHLEGATSTGLIRFSDARSAGIFLGWWHCNDGDAGKKWRESRLAKIALDGFEYRHVVYKEKDHWGGYLPITSFNLQYLLSFLAKQCDFSPQPYEHMAGLLRRAGQPGKANEILYAARERERNEQAKGWGRMAWLWLFNMGAGYGLGTYNWRAVFWAMLLVYIGVAVAASSPQWATHCPGWWYAYSLDKLIPFLELDPSFKFGVLHGWRRAYFFFFHQAMGALILFFLVSGLAGMVERRG